jgi:hypothetical protein
VFSIRCQRCSCYCCRVLMCWLFDLTKNKTKKNKEKKENGRKRSRACTSCWRTARCSCAASRSSRRRGGAVEERSKKNLKSQNRELRRRRWLAPSIPTPTTAPSSRTNPTFCLKRPRRRNTKVFFFFFFFFFFFLILCIVQERRIPKCRNMTRWGKWVLHRIDSL